MGGGNPVKKVTKKVSNVIDKVGNAVETAVQDTRNEVGRNLGADGQKALQAASDIATASTKQLGQGISGISQGTIEMAQGNFSPGFKQFKEGATGVALSSTAIPSAQAALKVVKEYDQKNIGDLTPIATDTGTSNTPTATPTPEKTAEELANDQYMQDQLASSKRKGRASTQLTGPQGLSGSTQYSARRTLLGV